MFVCVCVCTHARVCNGEEKTVFSERGKDSQKQKEATALRGT